MWHAAIAARLWGQLKHSQPYMRPFFFGVQGRLADAQLFFFIETELNYFFH